MPRLNLLHMIRSTAWPLALMAATALAQEAPPEEPAPAEGAPAEEPSPEEPSPEESAAPAPAVVDPGPAAAHDPTRRYRDIMVVPHRTFLKAGRIELAPSAGVNINDNLASDFAFGAEANYFFSEVLAGGLLFQYFPTPGGATELETDIRRRYHKFPTHNEYVFAGLLGASYVPIYGKFTVLSKWLVHWEAYVALGAGLVRTQTVPRDASLTPLTNNNPAVSPALGGRFFMSRWLSTFFTIRDYAFLDKFELETGDRDTQSRKDNAESRFVQNVILSLGVAVYFPMDFKYTTLR